MPRTIEPIIKADSVKALKDEINRLKAEISAAAESGEDCTQAITDLNKANATLASTLAKSKGEAGAAADSIAGLEQQSRALQQTLRVLSEDQKKSGIGKELVKQANDVSDALNDAKKDIGDYKNNIGRYTQSIEDAFDKMGISVKGITGPMQLASKGMSGLGKAMKALIANPLGLAIMAIVGAFRLLSNYLKNNKEAMDKLKKSIEPLQPVINAFKNIMDAVVGVLAEVVGWISEKLAGAFNWLLGAIPKVVNGVIDGINFIFTPAKYFYSWVIGAIEGIIKLINKIPGVKLDGVVEALDNAKNAVKDFEIGHINTDLTKLTERTEKATEETKKNTEAQKANTKAIEEREKALEELKKRLDENGKSQLQKLEEQYAKERELIKGNKEYERKLDNEYQIERTKIIVDFYQRVNDRISSALSDLPEHMKPILQAAAANTEKVVAKLGDHIEEVRSKIGKLGEEELNKWAEEYRNKIREEGFELDELIEDKDEGITKAQSLLDLLITLQAEESRLVRDYRNDAKAIEDDFAVDRLSKFINEATRAYNIMQKTRTYYAQSDSTERELDFGVTGWKTSNRNIQKEEIDAQRKLEDEDYQATKTYLNSLIEAYQKELDDWKGTEEQKIQLKAEMVDLEMQLNEAMLQHQISVNKRSLEDQKRHIENTKRIMGGLGSILDNAAGAWETLLDSQVDNGKKSKKDLEGQYKVVKGVQATSAIINAFLAANEAYSSLASIPYVGPALGAVAAAAALAAGLANAHAIATAKIGDDVPSSGSGSTGASTPALIDSTPYDYTRQLQTIEEEDQMNRPIFVSVTDIESGLNKANVVDKERTF